MPTFIALLRGVNVGKGKRVPMAELRALLAELGDTNVRTLLNSGNAVFDSARRSTGGHASAIGAAISAKLGVDTPVIVKSATELAAIVSANPIDAAEPDHSRVLVAFTQEAAPLQSLADIGRLACPPERFVQGSNAVYLFCANGILESRAATALLGKAGRAVTTRNWATVLKLEALAREK